MTLKFTIFWWFRHLETNTGCTYPPDYPNPPGNIRIIDRPSPGNLVLAWELPTGATLPATEFYNTPVTGYAVEVWDTGKAVGYQEWLTIPTSSTTSATLTGLHPGVRYSVRVLARNQAGTTPSSPVEVTTNASGEDIIVEGGRETRLGRRPLPLWRLRLTRIL